MNSTNNLNTNREVINDELDIKKLFITLWHRKIIIILIASIFAIATYVLSSFLTPVWTSTAVLKKTSLAKLGNFPQSEATIRSRDVEHKLDEPTPGLTEVVYAEFIQSIGSYDFKRDFWLKNTYYEKKSELLATEHEKSVLLEKLINDIQFTPKDERKGTLDVLTLKAETSAESNALLRQYIDESNQLIISRIINEVNQIKQNNLSKYKQEKEELLKAIEQDKKENIIQLLDKKKELISELNKLNGLLDSQPEDIAQVESMIQFVDEQLNYTQIIADEPDIRLQDLDYKIRELERLPEIKGFDKAFEFLRTPQEPIKADSPRKLFWAFLAALIGGFIGVCIALIQGPSNSKMKKESQA